MAKKKEKVEKAPRTPLERSIEGRERGIKRMEENKRRIMEDAQRRCAEIDRHLIEKRILLDALKRGQLKD